jgi:hypothetical protein
MSTTVHTGWKTVTPGRCMLCGFDDGWSCDGRGTILCDCQLCSWCGTPDGDGHTQGCPELEDQDQAGASR